VSRATTAREALIAELIGDMTELLDRMETLTPAMNDSRHKLTDTAARLTACVEPVKAHLVGTATQAQKTAVERIYKRTNEIAAESLRTQTRAMNDAARTIIDKEVGPPLRQLAATLQVLVERTRHPQWETWATYAATGAVSATFAVSIAVYFMHR
jgi:hypothetical protein